MSKRRLTDDVACQLVAASSHTADAGLTSLNGVVRELEVIQQDAIKLRKKLPSSSVTADSETFTWLSLAERMRADLPDSECRQLVESMNTTISNLLATLRKRRKVCARHK